MKDFSVLIILLLICIVILITLINNLSENFYDDTEIDFETSDMIKRNTSNKGNTNFWPTITISPKPVAPTSPPTKAPTTKAPTTTTKTPTTPTPTYGWNQTLVEGGNCANMYSEIDSEYKDNFPLPPTTISP